MARLLYHGHMNLFRMLTLVLPIALLAHGCKKEQPATRLQWPVMGTIAAVQCVDAAAAPHARDLAQDIFSALDAELSTWRADSALSTINRAAGTGEHSPAPADLTQILHAALALCNASDGAFNPLIGPVMKVWGFNGAASRPALPDTATLHAAVALTDWRQIDFTENESHTIRLQQPGMALDLGAIAKGYAVDAAYDALKAAGYANILVDLGGNLRALGEAAPGRGGWRTGIRDPFRGGALVAQFLLADGEGTATSGNYERFVDIDGVRYAHIMDPRTAKPVTGMAGVTVIAPTAMLSDGLSTTLFVLGVERGAELLEQYPGCEAVWVPDTPDAPVMFATPGFAKRLKPVGGAKLDIRIVDQQMHAFDCNCE